MSFRSQCLFRLSFLFPFILLFFPLPLVHCSSNPRIIVPVANKSRVVRQSFQCPEPRILCLPGHVGANQIPMRRMSMNDLSCQQIVVGQPYMLVVEMQLYEKCDYMLDRCSCNQLSPFVNSGCLYRNDQWAQIEEIVMDGIKFIVIYFYAPDSSLHFECQTRVFQCFSCCQNVCERRAPSGAFPSSPVSISIRLPPSVPAPFLPAVTLPPSASGGCSLPFAASFCSHGHILGLPPWFFWLLLALLLLLLLLLLCCALSFCIGVFGWRFRKIFARKGARNRQPPPLPGRVFVVDGSSQTMPPPPSPHPDPPLPFTDYETEQRRQRREWETDRHVAMPMKNIYGRGGGGGGGEWWQVEETIRREEEEVRTTEWRDEEERRRKERERKARGSDRRGRRNGMEAEEEAEEEEERRRWREEETRHYENWGWPTTDQRHPSSTPNGWTHFGTEPMVGVVAGEEEDQMHWRRTNGSKGEEGAVQEGGTRKYRQKSTF